MVCFLLFCFFIDAQSNHVFFVFFVFYKFAVLELLLFTYTWKHFLLLNDIKRIFLVKKSSILTSFNVKYFDCHPTCGCFRHVYVCVCVFVCDIFLLFLFFVAARACVYVFVCACICVCVCVCICVCMRFCSLPLSYLYFLSPLFSFMFTFFYCCLLCFAMVLFAFLLPNLVRYFCVYALVL